MWATATRIFLCRIFGGLLILIAALWIVVGCASKAVRPAREAGKPPQESPRQNAPSCSFVLDNDGSLIVDLSECAGLEEDNSAVVLKGSALGHPLFLTHLTDQLFYALDSRCGHGACLAQNVPGGILCPCDSTRYDFSGAVLSGPGTEPLREFPSLKNGHRIRITIAH
jgi:Rieske Fe-S protein